MQQLPKLIRTEDLQYTASELFREKISFKAKVSGVHLKVEDGEIVIYNKNTSENIYKYAFQLGLSKKTNTYKKIAA